MILVDSNVPMYLVGAPHRHKTDALSLLERLIGERRRLVTDVEVLQEIMHRYLAIRRPDAIQPAFDALLAMVDEVIAVELADVEKAKDIALGGYGLSARDALHLAVMARRDIRSIISFDQGFDLFPGVERIRC